ncbi:hypothetical protein M9H77_35776 [Catharanthus roseus]|uniref:Uncharacterized protein n=1 Tax=Catharanthus roseus TaxID=4058 RepID=A0ACB9ZR83_CATRO|nr:hypothetical protein M9H77_35776 [Catharanthus roseus]
MTALLHPEVEVHMMYLIYSEVAERGTYDVPAPLKCNETNGVKPKLNVEASRSGLSNGSSGAYELGSPRARPPDPPPLSLPCLGSACPRLPGCGGTRTCPLRALPPGNLRAPLFTPRAPRSGTGSRG